HRQGLLGGRRVIQIHQRFAMHFLVKNGKVLSDFLDVIAARRRVDFTRRFDYGTHPTSSQVRSTSEGRSPAKRAVSGSHSITRRSRWLRTCSELMRSRHSMAQASSDR